jgi:hypothetical protein
MLGKNKLVDKRVFETVKIGEDLEVKKSREVGIDSSH